MPRIQPGEGYLSLEEKKGSMKRVFKGNHNQPDVAGA